MKTRYTPAQQAAGAQQSHDAELGLSYANAMQKITARVFRHNLTNEIFYDPTLNYGVNTNLDPTRRQGFELDAEQKINAAWSVSAHYQHVQAKFREGVNNGKEMVLVPKNTLTARLSWTGQGQTADVGVQWWTSSVTAMTSPTVQRRDPFLHHAGCTLCAQVRPVGVGVSGQNLTDKHYYSQAFSCKGGIYPSNGRQLKISARYDF
jgi:iron complex outermembrane receptor protein